MEHPMIKLLELQQKEIAELNMRIATMPNKDNSKNIATQTKNWGNK